MENKPQILEFFPIPIWTSSLPSKLSGICTYLDSQEMISAPQNIRHNWGSRSKSSYILNESPCYSLSNFILSQVLTFGKNILNYSYDKYKFTQSWISHKAPGESHQTHNHPNSLISGVMYYGKMSELTPQILFFNPNLESNLKPKFQPPNNNIFTSQYLPIAPLSGTLILFPSSLLHSVPNNETNEIRKSLAFNIVPTEGFGDEEGLTELKFN